MRILLLMSMLGLATMAAAGAAAGEGRETTKVWTNEDLDRLFGPAEPSSGEGEPEFERAAQQEFVEAFLERHRRWLDAEKERELRREEIRAARPQAQPRRAVLFAPISRTGWWWPAPGPGSGPMPRTEPGVRKHAWQVNPMNRPVVSSARGVHPTRP